MARATAYRMFGGREALVSAIVANELESLRAKLIEWGADEPDIAVRVHTRLTESLKYIREHEALQYVLRNEPEEVVRSLITTNDSTRSTLITMIVDASIEDLRPDEVDVLAPNPRAAIEFLVRVVYSCMLVPGSAMTDDEIADLVVRAVVR